MKIRSKISLLFTALAGAILVSFAGTVYYSAREDRETEFYNSLEREAITKANLFFSGSLPAPTLQTIYRTNRRTLHEVEVAIFDTGFHLLYHDAADLDFVKETGQMIREIRQKKEIQFYQQQWQVVGLLYPFRGRNYIITATAYDQYGHNKIDNLGRTILVVLVCSVVLIFAAGRFFSKKVLSPVTRMVNEVKVITATNLDLRINEGNNRDELSELAITFNQMLDRLERSFDGQKSFVSNISHELRTPLSAMIAELELASARERSTAEYKTVVHNVLGDAQRLAKLSQGLLDLAKASFDHSEMSFKALRLDELLLEARGQVLRANPEYRVQVTFEREIEEDRNISVEGNQYLLKVAFVNLIQNGCKFSASKQSSVTISFSGRHTILRFADKGIGLGPQDLPHIFTPFYRGAGGRQAGGYGIGLSLTDRVIRLHKGTISVASRPGKGTTFTVELPHL
ncbi:HAMP domain-containing sensor histidine kinase [Paraflavisolibacter sp. H34]|uniref:HAMP domain-containing sensor histidine kinase n=1 Tax=Huijunlia imazamoxiresistens TaxID=3127457 RepID=UPI00301AE670